MLILLRNFLQKLSKNKHLQQLHDKSVTNNFVKERQQSQKDKNDTIPAHHKGSNPSRGYQYYCLHHSSEYLDMQDKV